MGESLATPGVAYAGVLMTWFAFVLCVVLFERRRWASLLFWMGTGFGALIGQAHALWVAGDTSGASWWTSAAIGAVLGMPVGGIAADWWQERLLAEVGDEPEGVERGSARPDAPRYAVDEPWEDELWEDELVTGADDYPVFEAEPVGR